MALSLLLPALFAANLPGAEPVGSRSDAPYHFALGKILREEGAFEQAGEHLRLAVFGAPGDAYLRIEYADFLLDSGDAEGAARELEAASSLAPADPAALKRLGHLLLQLARQREPAFAEARKVFEQLRSSRPGDLDVMSTLGRVYLSEQRFALAAEVFAESLGYWPQNRALHGSRIDALLRAGAMAEAAEAIEEFLRVDPQAIRARMTLADLKQRSGDSEGAFALLAATPRDSSGDVELFRQLAFALYEGRLFGDALYWLDRSLAAAGEGEQSAPQSLYLRALLLTAEDRAEEARGVLREMLASDPDRLDALELLARHLFGAGLWQETVALLAPRLDGGWDDQKAELVLLQAEALRRLDRADEALSWLVRAAETPDLRERALARQAETLLGLERGDDADEVLRELTADGSRRTLLMAAEACQREESFARSVPFLERLIGDSDSEQGDAGVENGNEEEGALAEEAELQALFWLGAAYERTGRTLEAEGHFQRFLQRRPDSAPALNYLGYMWADEGTHLDRALELIERAVALDPDNGAYVDSLGWAHFQLGNYQQARSRLERAAELMGDDAVVLEHLGDVYRVLGEREGAAEAYRRALELGADNVGEVQLKLQRLDQP